MLPLVALPVVVVLPVVAILWGAALLFVRGRGRVVLLAFVGALPLVGTVGPLFRIAMVLSPLRILVKAHGIQIRARYQGVPCRG